MQRDCNVLGDGSGVQRDCVGVCVCVCERDVGRLGAGSFFHIPYSIQIRAKRW